MKTKLLMLIVIVLIGGMLMWMPGMVFAKGHGGGGHGGGGHGGGHHGGGHSDFDFSFGLGYYGFYPNYYSPYYYPSYYPYYPSYYSPGVVYIDPPAPPPVVVQSPVVVQQYSQPVQQYSQPVQQYSQPVQALDQIGGKKAQLLDQLQQGDIVSRLQAINQLAEFSFDDQVMSALENVLQYDSNAAVRKAVAETFGEVKNQKALGVLEKARVEDQNLEVRRAADIAINKIKN